VPGIPAKIRTQDLLTIKCVWQVRNSDLRYYPLQESVESIVRRSGSFTFHFKIRCDSKFIRVTSLFSMITYYLSHPALFIRFFVTLY
jgi:hypothetical protein